MFVKSFFAGWGDMDFNAHMKNTAYLDKSGDCRMMFFAEHGFPMREFIRLKIGPVVMKDEIEYFKEVNLLEEIHAHLSLGGLSDDGSRFLMRNEFIKIDGRLAGRVHSLGGWMHLAERKLVAPPENLLKALRLLPQTDNFQTLPSSVR